MCQSCSVWQRLMGHQTVSVRVFFMCLWNYYVWLKWLKVRACRMRVCVCATPAQNTHTHPASCANKYASVYASIVTQKVKSWQASWRPHLPHVTLVCQNNLHWQTWYDILSVLGYSVHESSIITSLMALEWGQSLMTWCFMALLEIFALTWEGCRYFL